uniref:CD81 molecule n=1 Tax=Sus scrofa TaxID=9823 RepID=A0A8D1GSN4_PIG
MGSGSLGQGPRWGPRRTTMALSRPFQHPRPRPCPPPATPSCRARPSGVLSTLASGCQGQVLDSASWLQGAHPLRDTEGGYHRPPPHTCAPRASVTRVEDEPGRLGPALTAPPRPQFFTCLVILFACEVAAGIWGFVNKDQIAKDVKQFYDQALQQAIVDDDANNAKAVVKTFHETLNCCGSNTLTTLTTSVLKNSLCPSGGNIISNLMKEDCHSKIDELFSGKLYLIGIAAIVVAVIMIFEMILSMVLCCGIRNSSVY